MRKEFSPKNLCVYALKYFLVIVILAVVGLGAGLMYGIINDRRETVRFEGNLAVVGISEFYGTDSSNLTEGQVATYDKVRENVLSASVARELITQIYNENKDEWKRLTKQNDEKTLQKNFFKRFSVWRSDFYIYVQMGAEYSRSDNSVKRAEMKDFSLRVINRYLEIAVESAKNIEGVSAQGGGDGIIKVTSASLTLPDTEDSLGLLKGMAFGFAVGFIAGLMIVCIMYLFDGRITSYGDVASLTGKRLLGVNGSDGNGSLYPNIDCEAGGGSLLVCGGEKVCRKIAEGYARYGLKTGRSALLVDCGNPGDALGEYMTGRPLGECVKTEDGLDVLYGGDSWQAAVRNADTLSREALECDLVIFSAPYRGDGRLNVLSTVADKLMVAIDQKEMRMNDVLALMHETQFSDKVIGAAIDNTGKSFVGGNIYVAPAEEDIQ